MRSITNGSKIIRISVISFNSTLNPFPLYNSSLFLYLFPYIKIGYWTLGAHNLVTKEDNFLLRLIGNEIWYVEVKKREKKIRVLAVFFFLFFLAVSLGS